MKVTVQVHAAGRDARPAGPGVPALAGTARLRRRRRGAHRQAYSSSRSTADDPARPQARAMCDQLLANALIEDYEVEAGGRRRERRGRRRRASRARWTTATRAPRGRGWWAPSRSSLWHADADLPTGRDAVIAARRLLLRRPPALRRHRQPCADHGRGAPARRGRRAGARHLQRLPGAVRGRPAAGRAAPQRRRCRSSAARTRPRGRATPARRGSPGRRRRARASRSRSSTTTAAGSPTRDVAGRGARPGAAALRRDNPNGSIDARRRRGQPRRATCSG